MPENLYRYFPTNNPSTWELMEPSKDNHTTYATNNTPNGNNNHNDWTHITHEKHKQYTFIPTKAPTNNRNNPTTNTNTIPLGRHLETTQTFLDDLGFTNPTRPGPMQQYRTPSQQQRTETH